MRRVSVTSCAFALILLAITASRAADLASFEILRLRLGMAEAQVDAVLAGQGIPASRIRHEIGPCQEYRGCDATITAPTVDGVLTIRLVPNTGASNARFVVAEVVYSLGAAAFGRTDAIVASLVERFGPPNQAHPMQWCKTIASTQACTPDQPSLRFSPDTLTLMLSAAKP